MYSLVLMAAVAAGPDDAGFGGRLFGGGCCGGAPVASCCGGAPVGCCGGVPVASCCGGGPVVVAGCCGGGGFLGHRFRHHASCCGGVPAVGCCGGGCWSSSAAWGGCYGSMPPYSGCHGGCYGGGVVVPDAGVIVGSAAPAGAIPVGAVDVVGTADKAAAVIVVEVPAAATLYVDGKAVRGDGPTRRFHTPALARGTSYFYDMKAEVLVNGKVEVEEKRVVVKAGDSLTESFARLAAVAAAAPTPVAVR